NVFLSDGFSCSNGVDIDGLNYFTKGFTIGGEDSNYPLARSYSDAFPSDASPPGAILYPFSLSDDYCLSDSYVREFYIEGNYFVRSTDFYCPAGCVGGACVSFNLDDVNACDINAVYYPDYTLTAADSDASKNPANGALFCDSSRDKYNWSGCFDSDVNYNPYDGGYIVGVDRCIYNGVSQPCVNSAPRKWFDYTAPANPNGVVEMYCSNQQSVDSLLSFFPDWSWRTIKNLRNYDGLITVNNFNCPNGVVSSLAGNYCKMDSNFLSESNQPVELLVSSNEIDLNDEQLVEEPVDSNVDQLIVEPIDANNFEAQDLNIESESPIEPVDSNELTVPSEFDSNLDSNFSDSNN
ncbi:MAG: hypothetical protein PHQ98_04705, partial [Candidatus ainarchaeum sp.]|nr:hypothetical protein [Candidatus ainarchaeum sp.]